VNRKTFLIAAALVSGAAVVFPCSRTTPQPPPEEVVAKSDLIVRVTAVEAIDKETIRFRIDEVIAGRHAPMELTLPGQVSDADDFNKNPVPYASTRPSGLWGMCYPQIYRIGAQYLFLLKLRSGDYTAHWEAFAPTDEQLHDAHDPWLAWVRAQVKIGHR